MSTTILNEHDANQGAQSKGEFLGMTGNSAWYLLGSAGVTVMMVIVLWGVFEISLLFCIVAGLVLCLLSVVYVFALKNNKPAHYDTDFFESVLVEAGILELAFGPRTRCASNPFASSMPEVSDLGADAPKPAKASSQRPRESSIPRAAMMAPIAHESPAAPERPHKAVSEDNEPMIARAAYERVKADLMETQDHLEEALLEHAED